MGRGAFVGSLSMGRFGLAGVLCALSIHLVAAKALVVGPPRRGKHEGFIRLVLDLPKKLPYRIFVRSSPSRLVVELPPLRWHLGPAGSHAWYQIVSFPQKNDLVVPMGAPLFIKRHFYLKGPSSVRLVVDVATVQPPKKRRPSPKKRPLPHYSTAARAPLVLIQKPLVVIDAGHGGQDPGALGVYRVREKTINLRAAKTLKRLLELSRRYRVVLTRSRDIYIPLSQRYHIAEKYHADFFISLHSDKVLQSVARGATVYTLSEVASDREAARLARHENRSDLVAGVNLSKYDRVVKRTLLDFEQRDTINRSLTFVQFLLPRLRGVVRLHERPHRFAGFRVLKSPVVPSVLFEMGYLSNPLDVHLLVSPSYLLRMAYAIRHGFDCYFSHADIAHKELYRRACSRGV